MKVLVACEYSGIVRDAFIEKGHDAWSCDLLPTESDKNRHIQGDVLELLKNDWDLIIAHPPCTFIANSGVRWLYNKDGSHNLERWQNLKNGTDFFNKFLSDEISHVSRIAIENPIPHKHAKLPPHSQCVQPWMFGENESKAVCLWLKGLPLLKPKTLIKPEIIEQRVWRMAPGPDRQKERSRFFKGIAIAMAEQWGEIYE